MEQRATIFVEAMIVFAVIGVLAFLIGLIVRAPQRRQAAAGTAVASEHSPRWYEFTLALILLAAIAAFAIWLISSGTHWVWGETIEDWRTDTRTIVFAAVMVALAAIGLVVSLVYALMQSSQSPTALPAARRTLDVSAAAETAPTAAAAPPAPSPARILGLLGLAVAVLLLCWIGLTPAGQYGLLAQLIYPASFAVVLVLLFDKATRTWSVKGAAESVSEWLLCDLLAFLLVISFLNLRSAGAKPEAYTGSFWDILNLVLFFAAFWALDRTAARSRFLVGYGYLVVLPLMLLILQALQGAAAAASWWATMWPFLILAGVFFVLEAVTLVSSGDDGRRMLPAVKDALFVLLYAVLLIVAAKSA